MPPEIKNKRETSQNRWVFQYTASSADPTLCGRHPVRLRHSLTMMVVALVLFFCCCSFDWVGSESGTQGAAACGFLWPETNKIGVRCQQCHREKVLYVGVRRK